MQQLRTTAADFAAKFAELTSRTSFTDEIEASVREILRDVQDRGDAAVAAYAQKFDGVQLTPGAFALGAEAIAAAKASLSADELAAIELAHEQIRAFSAKRLPQDWDWQARDGVALGERFVPLSRIAAYVPGGTAPLVSTVLHTITMAAVAGVPEIVVTSPPTHNGTIHPAIVAAAELAGATEILQLGGVYAIGALAYGTDSVKKVDKIVGPGNAWVTAAKRMVYGHCALDLVAGPSEVLILADETAEPRFIAADMLAQAEHGSGREQAVLVTTCEAHLEAVAAELERQAAERQRSECIAQVMQNGILLVYADTMASALAVTNDYSAEHLEIQTRNPRETAKSVTAAGAMFLGPWTPEPIGDFVAGPSHVLPTGGAARYFNGLTVEQFFRRMSVVQYDRAALARERAAAVKFAEMEQLDGHGRSVTIRFD